MNLLAHTFLSGESEKILVGNFIGDFVRGNQFQDYEEEIGQGILLHRKIDSYTDKHPMARQSAQRLVGDYSKYSPVLVDIFYDHFLAINFEKYSDISLTEHSQKAYQILSDFKLSLPDKVQRFLPSMIQQNWLEKYADLEGIYNSLDRINQRAQFSNNLDLAILNLQEQFQEFETDFLNFFPDIISFVEGELLN